MAKSFSTPKTSPCLTPIRLELPYPPSTNTYWRRVGNRTVLSKAARAFRKRVVDLWFVQKYVFRRDGFDDHPVALKLVAQPPDRRKRDLDNLCKAVLDGLQAARIIGDDVQVRKLELEWGDPAPDGRVTVWIEPLAGKEGD